MPDTARLPVQIYLLGRFEIIMEESRLRATGWTRRKAATAFQY